MKIENRKEKENTGIEEIKMKERIEDRVGGIEERKRLDCWGE